MYDLDYNSLDVSFTRPNGKSEIVGSLKKGIEIQCHDKSHKKYYQLSYNDGHLIRKWGRIGNKPQSKVERMDQRDAYYEVSELLEDKYKKGYRMEKDMILHELGIL
jgi:predicted DNA-binding WGR domain protein